MILNTLFMGKPRQLVMAAAAALALAGCNEAQAEGNDQPEQAEFTKLAAVVETTTITREQCMALMPDMHKLKACMIEREKQLDAEIAAKSEERASNAETIAIQNTEAKELDTTIEGLRKVVALQEGEQPQK